MHQDTCLLSIMLLYLWFVMSVETVELIWSNLQFVFYAKWFIICKVNLHVWFFDIVRVLTKHW